MTISRGARVAAACLSLLSASLVMAEEGPYKGGFAYSGDGAAPGADDSLYVALGGQEKIAAFTKDFVARLTKDDRIGHYFEEIDLERLTVRLTDQFIELAGGPVKYKGRGMATIHRKLGITNADFNRLVEDLQMSMDKYDVPFATQNRLLALLAPMQRDVVTK